MSTAAITPQVQLDQRALPTQSLERSGGGARQVQFEWLLKVESGVAPLPQTKEVPSPRGTRRRRTTHHAGNGAADGRSNATDSSGSSLATRLPPSSIDNEKTGDGPISPRHRVGAALDQSLQRPRPSPPRSRSPPQRNAQHAALTDNARRPGQQRGMASKGATAEVKAEAVPRGGDTGLTSWWQSAAASGGDVKLPTGTRDEEALLNFSKAFEVEHGRLPSSEEDWRPVHKTRSRVQASRDAPGQSTEPAVGETRNRQAPPASAPSKAQPLAPAAGASSSSGVAGGDPVTPGPVRTFSSELPSATRLVRTFSNASHGMVRPQPRRVSDAVQVSTSPPRRQRQRWFSTPLRLVLRLPRRESSTMDTTLPGVHQSPAVEQPKSVRMHGFRLARTPPKNADAEPEASASLSERPSAARPNRSLDRNGLGFSSGKVHHQR